MLLRPFFALALLASGALASCSIGPHADPRGSATAADPDCYHQACVVALRSQVRKEFEAALQYLLMGAHFARDDVDLAGFARMFFEHADEERQHGTLFIEYLRMRGDAAVADLLGDGDALLPILGKSTWLDAEEALRDALAMEKLVTGSIKRLVDACDNEAVQDYHAADWLTGTWLDEQLAGQRMLAGMINTLNTFRRDHEELADWMFNRQLLENGH